MIVSKDADRTQKPLMKGTPSKPETEGRVLGDKAHLQDPTADVTLNGGTATRGPPRWRERLSLVSTVLAGLVRQLGAGMR